MKSAPQTVTVTWPSYGLENDPVFRTLCADMAGPKLLKVESPVAGSVYFLRGAFSLAGRRFGHLLPLCGLFSAPAPSETLESFENWAAIARGLSGEKGWINVRLPGLEPRAAAIGRRALLKNGMASRKGEYNVRVISGKKFEQYLADRGGEFRRRHRSFRSSMSAKGLEYGNPAEIGDWIELYRKRHPVLHGEDYSVTDEYQTFFSRCLENYRKEGRCIEVTVRKGSTLLAAGFTIIFKDVAYFYQTAHDPAAEEFRPGALVFYKMIESALEHGCGLLSFMGDAPYLHIYTREVLQRMELEAFSRTLMGVGLFAYRSLKRVKVVH